jgi:hypothetical protein
MMVLRALCIGGVMIIDREVEGVLLYAGSELLLLRYIGELVST